MIVSPIRANPDVNLDVDSLTLNVGLDLVSAKLLAEKGSLQDCLNREIVDSIGYRRIDGLDKYDGRVSPTQEEIFLIYNTSYGSGVTTDFAAGDYLVITGTTNVFGKVVTSTYTASGTVCRVYYARINKDYEPTTSQTVAVFGEAQTFAVTGGIYTLSGADPVTATTPSASSVVTSLNTYNATLRTAVTDLDDTPIGLHWYRDKLYAVVTEPHVYFTSGGTTEVKPNYYIKGNTTNTIGRVLDVDLVSGEWSPAGTAAGMIQFELISGTGFNTSETLSYDESSGFASPISADVATLASSGTSTPQYASLWRSRSEQQSVTDATDLSLVGWDRIDHGWELTFENGYSDTGDLVKVSRGTTNNFTYTTSSVTGNSPTDVYNGAYVDGASFCANSRSPFSVLVNDANPGWKSTASSAVFASDADLETAISGSGTPNAYANIWYSFSAQLGSSSMYARDTDVLGPANYPATGNIFGGTAAAGAVTLDSDWFSTQARAPIILKDLSAAMSTIPVGSLITGIAVVVNYGSRHYAAGQFQASAARPLATFVTDCINAINGSFSFESAVVDVTTPTVCTLLGTAQTAAVTVETDSGDYTSSTSVSGYDDLHKMAQTAALTGQTATVGGSGNTFGLGATSRNYWLDANKAIALYCNVTSTPTYGTSLTSYRPVTTTFYEQVEGQVRLVVTEIKVTFYYTTPSARYYVGDGTGTSAVCSVDVIYTVTTDGVWESRTAEGTIQVTNLDSSVDAHPAKYTIEAGDQLFLTGADAAAGTNEIADITAAMVYNGLASIDRVVDESARYQFITANFFGRDDWDGFYGVNGADRAFSFATFDADGAGGDEDYIIRIATNTEDTDGDTPRHIAYHHGHLALGFSSGIVRLSALGEPENFDGVDGAAEVGLGDKVTGLLAMRGMTLGVFCENSIHAIAGTSVDDYTTQVLAPYTGAIEYTVLDMGIPVYCDSRGISTLEQSERYGNFLGQRLSSKVSPWIIPRMVRNNDLFSVANGTGVVCAIPVRAKNQYRLYFKDGYVLVMTMNADGSPSFTYSKYYLGMTTTADTDRFLVPFAWSSQVDNNGIERIHVSHYSSNSNVASETTLENYVFELDKGWSFAGNYIPEFYTLNPVFRDPFTETNIRKIRLDGLTKGVGDNEVTTAKDYSRTFGSQATDISLTKIGPSTASTTYSTDFYAATNMANVAERGRSISLKVTGSGSISAPVPSDIHQIMLVQYAAGGKRDS